MEEKEPKPRYPLITKVWAKNFRSIESAELEMGPLTVLVGPNASGKSNLLDVLRFLADTFRDDLEAAITSRGGMNSVVCRARNEATMEIRVRFESDESIVDYEFGIARRGRGEHLVRREHAIVTLAESAGHFLEIEIRNGRLTKLDNKQASGAWEEPDDTLKAAKRALVGFPFDPADLELCWRLRWALERAKVTLGEDPILANALQAITLFSFHLSRMNFYHSFPNQLRDAQKMGDSYPLREHGENLASVLHDMIRTKSPFLPDLNTALKAVVPGAGGLRVKRAGSYLVVELEHQGADTRKSTWFDLSYESDGTLRLLALLTALYQDPPPSLIAIEEPELTIHPGALAVLADVIREASLRTQVLVTTHSADLIDRLPIECIRAVDLRDGATTVGTIAEHQREAVRKGLFSAGELHRMEGLQLAGKAV